MNSSRDPLPESEDSPITNTPLVNPRGAGGPITINNANISITFPAGNLHITSYNFYYSPDEFNNWSQIQDLYSLIRIGNNPVEALYDNGQVTIIEPLHVIDQSGGYSLLYTKIRSMQASDVNISVFIELIPNRASFKMVAVFNSSTRDAYSAKLIPFCNTELRGDAKDYQVQYETTADYRFDQIRIDATKSLPNDEHFAFCSNLTSTAHQADKTVEVEADAWSDVWGNRNEQHNDNGEEYAMGMRYSNSSMQLGQSWAVPVVFGIGTNSSVLMGNLNTYRNLMMRDIAVENISYYQQAGVSYVDALVVNLGTIREERTINLTVGGQVKAQKIVSLQPGGIQTVTFAGVGNYLTPNFNNDIRIVVVSKPNDETANNEKQLLVYYEPRGDLEVQVQGNSNSTVSGMLVQLLNDTTETLLAQGYTNEQGNVTFTNLLAGSYNIAPNATWYDHNVSLTKQKITTLGKNNYTIYYTNISQLDIQVLDYTTRPVMGVNAIFQLNNSQVLVANLTTNAIGNITFKWYDFGYNISAHLWSTGWLLNLSVLSNYNITRSRYFTFETNISSIFIHLAAKDTGDPIMGAKVHFFNGTSTTDPYIGNLISNSTEDSNKGNVTFTFLVFANYTIQVEFFSKNWSIDGPPYDSYLLDFTFGNLTVYNYTIVLVDVNPATYMTEILLLTATPITATWTEDITIKVLMNVTFNGTDPGGPMWANQMSITIRNASGSIIYIAPIPIVPSETGNHSIIFNSAAIPYMSGGTPAIYEFRVEGVIIGYTHATALDQSFYVYRLDSSLQISDETLSMRWNETALMRVRYIETQHGTPITDATAVYRWAAVNGGENIQLNDEGYGWYNFTINTVQGSTGTYVIDIELEKPSYTPQKKKIILIVSEALTTLNESSVGYNLNQWVYYSVNETYDFHFKNIMGYGITTASAWYTWRNQITNATGNASLSELPDLGPGIYRLNFTDQIKAVGTYGIWVLFEKTNYASKFAFMQFEIKKIVTSGEILFNNEGDMENVTSQVTFTFEEGQSFQLIFNYSDVWGVLIKGANVSVSLMQGTADFSQYITITTAGNTYIITISTSLTQGSYSLMISFSSENYETISFSRGIVVIWKTFLGLPIFTWYLILGTAGLFVFSFATYRYIKWQRLPDMVKKIIITRKELLKGNEKLITKVTPSFYEQLVEQYANAWSSFDLKHPFIAPDLKIMDFTLTFNRLTQKALLYSEGEQYLNNIIIFSEDQIREQLRTDGVRDGDMPKILDILHNFIRKNLDE